MRNKYVSKITTVALLTAIEIIISRFMGISTPFLKISFSFIPMSLVAMMYGPAYSTVMAASADFIGAILFPVGMYFPGYTITAAMTGFTYGICLYKKKNGWSNIIIAVVIINLCLRLGLNSFWVHMTTGKAMPIIMMPRILKNMIMIPIEVLIVGLVREKLLPLLNRLVD